MALEARDNLISVACPFLFQLPSLLSELLLIGNAPVEDFGSWGDYHE
jgi:MbtH protein